ncbi:MAG: hypothetical protein EOP49_25165 [Sphingobacteriales bacterium]|nr:MAG: hypothetical protein EOP49_25165 [Sphingobacteriales bacterium]
MSVLRLMHLSRYQTEQLRIASALIDRMLFLPLFLVEKQFNIDDANHGLLIGWLIMIAMLHMLYAAWLHHRYGYTFGKWLVGIRVFDLSESRNLTWKEGIRREALYFIIELTVIFAFYFNIAGQQGQGFFFEKYHNLTRNVSLVWIFVTLSVMLSNPKRRSIPDFFGKSVVVKC